MSFDDPRIKFVSINLAATGDLVTAVPGYKIRVLNYTLVSGGTVSVNFESGTTDISGVMPTAANGSISSSGPCFETASGEKLALTLSASVNIDGHLAYVLIPG